MRKHNREPVKHTCPDINKLIKGLDEIAKMIKGYDRIDDVDDLKDIISDIENTLSDYDSTLEDLRYANDSLREWGINEAEEVDKLENKLYSYENA